MPIIDVTVKHAKNLCIWILQLKKGKVILLVVHDKYKSKTSTENLEEPSNISRQSSYSNLKAPSTLEICQKEAVKKSKRNCLFC